MSNSGAKSCRNQVSQRSAWAACKQKANSPTEICLKRCSATCSHNLGRVSAVPWQASAQDVPARWSPSERRSVERLSVKTKRKVKHCYSKSFSGATRSRLSLTKVAAAILPGCPGSQRAPEHPSLQGSFSRPRAEFAPCCLLNKLIPPATPDREGRSSGTWTARTVTPRLQILHLKTRDT